MNNKSILCYDFREQQKRNEIWIENRKHRRSIYNSFEEYIEFLEKLLLEEKDEYQKSLIEKRIKKLKKEQEKYYDPCILAMKLPGKNYDTEEEPEEKKTLIKRLFNKNI